MATPIHASFLFFFNNGSTLHPGRAFVTTRAFNIDRPTGSTVPHLILPRMHVVNRDAIPYPWAKVRHHSMQLPNCSGTLHPARPSLASSPMFSDYPSLWLHRGRLVDGTQNDEGSCQAPTQAPDKSETFAPELHPRIQKRYGAASSGLSSDRKPTRLARLLQFGCNLVAIWVWSIFAVSETSFA